MTGKKWKSFKLVSMLLVLSAFCCAVAGEQFNSISLWIKLGIIASVSAAYLALFIAAYRNLHSFVSEMETQLDLTERDSLYKFPAPAAVVDKAGTIIWYNKAFSEQITDEDKYGTQITSLFDIDLEKLHGDEETVTSVISGNYRIKALTTAKRDLNTRSVVSELTLLYFEDIGDYLKLTDEYRYSRMWVMLILIDSYEELFTNVKDSDKSGIIMQIDRLMEGIMEENRGIIKKISSDRFLVIIDEEYLQKLMSEQFRPILDKMRSIVVTDKTNVTVSIGVGHGGKTIADSEEYAKKALDMTQGRGGDQVAVKDDNDFTFFGGASKEIKHTKVRTRVFSMNLMQLVEQSDKVILMGHRFGDFDSIGACAGMCGALRKLGYDSQICVDCSRTLAGPIIDRLKENLSGGNDIFITPEEALAGMTDRTLLIIADTSSKDMIESHDVYEAAKHVVYIDHHRQVVNSIDNAVIALHEPYASSASEIVAEVIQYMQLPEPISGYYADAMLSGIMLDTKDFVNKTGVRTFEAAAYLRKIGADTVAVKQLFANSLESCRKRSEIIASAVIHNRCAIAKWTEPDDDVRIFSAQAADQLLEIEDVDASFVLFVCTVNDKPCINISARSYGVLNVQLIMEKLGGGGHQTMAAAQVYDNDIDTAQEMLSAAIDEYIASIS